MIRVLLTALAFASTGAAAQTMYKCVLGGKTVYQAEPCPDAAKQDTLKPQGGGPAAAVPRDAPGGKAAASGGIPADVEQTIEFMSTYRACADGVKIWGEEMREPYNQWKSRNAAAVARVENDSRYNAQYQDRVNAKRNGTAGMCREVALTLRGK
jgi:Domain of unknown function (DUF4124)